MSAALHELELPLDACIRSLAINSDAPHSLLLGAGASITSGVPAAGTCTWMWKRDIFLAHHPTLKEQFEDLSLPSVQARIQSWLDAQGSYPPLESPEEYSYYAERCYPIPDDRRQFFQRLIKDSKPHAGYHLLALLAECGMITSVWTTNFDSLAPRVTIQSRVTPIEVGLDTTNRILRQPRTGELLCVALHGDYRYDALKNTSAELLAQDEDLRSGLAANLRDSSLIVSGFSGRDRSVMRALEQAYAQPGSGRLYWCVREGDELPESVVRLLRHARKQGRTAFYTPTNGFDDLMTRLASHALGGEMRERVLQIYQSFSLHRSTSKSFKLSGGSIRTILRSNSFLLECPPDLFQFSASFAEEPGGWERLRELAGGCPISAGLLKRKVLALGTPQDIRKVFSSEMKGDLQRVPIDEDELLRDSGVITSILRQALVRAIAEVKGLGNDGDKVVWQKSVIGNRVIQGVSCQIHAAALLSLRRLNRRQHLVVKPTVKVTTAGVEHIPIEIEREIKRQILTKQYNREFNDQVSVWANELIGKMPSGFEYPPSSGSGFRFRLLPVPALAAVSALTGKRTDLPVRIGEHVEFEGVEFAEPKLAFSNKLGTARVYDPHPIRGITANQPYDYSLTQSGLGLEVQLGVVCPPGGAIHLAKYLQRLLQQRPPDSKAEYLLQYPGFSAAFGLPLKVPSPDCTGWVDCSDPVTSGSSSAPMDLARSVTGAISSLAASGSPNVIVVFIPERWRHLERDAATGFDLHDYVKAYCVQRGIPTQFIREATLRKPSQCEVLWWLALSLYVKSMRTPWVLQDLAPDTAFAGIGYSVDRSRRPGDHIILGCSHLFGSNGQSLNYRLSKIEQLTWRNHNPHMSGDDARRTGENIRQMYYESSMRVPRRVVIHKHTPFLPEERDGLLEGLAGVEEIDMLEISIESSLRFVAARLLGDGKVDVDMFPVKRGTALVLDSERALIWVHGTTEGLAPSRRYYQGKSRIPAPLMLRRHYGSSDLPSVTREILGLSKMNWNTFDMYTKEPATIASSSTIARIGSLLDRFGPKSYDYRLFI